MIRTSNGVLVKRNAGTRCIVISMLLYQHPEGNVLTNDSCDNQVIEMRVRLKTCLNCTFLFPGFYPSKGKESVVWKNSGKRAGRKARLEGKEILGDIKAQANSGKRTLHSRTATNHINDSSTTKWRFLVTNDGTRSQYQFEAARSSRNKFYKSW